MRINYILLVSWLIVISLCMPPLSQFEGFGTDMAIKIYKQVIGIDEISINTSIQSHTYIKIVSNRNIQLQKLILIRNLTDIIIEGPATLVNYGIYIQNSTNIIIHNLRVINASIYGVLVYGSANVVINSLTILDASRTSVDQGKCVDITQQSYNITVSNSILGYTHYSEVDKYKGMLLANFLHGPLTNISLHHNIFYQNYQRSPQISTPGLFDFKNNIIYGFTVYGSRIREKAYGNFQSNFYIGGKKDPMVFVDESASLSFSRDNHWKFNFTTWLEIPDLGSHKYAVPIVTAYNLSSLLNIMKKWGCQPESYFEREVRQNILKNCQGNIIQSEAQD